jgi:AmmeMemoRadiSam system protein B
MINPRIRPARHAGSAYQPLPSELNKEVALYLSRARAGPPSRVLLVPHGTYFDCGPTLAEAYARLPAESGARVFLFGISHLKYFKGCAISGF